MQASDLLLTDIIVIHKFKRKTVKDYTKLLGEKKYIIHVKETALISKKIFH